MRQLAMQIASMLPEDSAEARQVLRLANELLDLALDDTTPRPIEPPDGEGQQHAADEAKPNRDSPNPK